MDFELKTLTLAGAAGEKCEALVVLVGESFKPGKDVLSKLAGDALKARDLEPKAGKLLHAYRSDGVAAGRVILAGAGDGSAKRIHSAVQAAVATLRTTGVKRLVICLPPDAGDDGVRAAVTATAETSYVYVATKSKPEGRELQRVTIAVTDKARHQGAFHAARSAAEGIEYARELGNLPPNHATPTRLGEEARKLAKAHGFQCEVLGPKEIAKAGM
ncbi:MAG TPA: M17 family peptidase N-terminal domain-containing protein, partial [Ramlibacter sp.]|nr:M17 family peptidase N-terminal domain-containing protein [Ramlibacter sp.]